MRIDFDLMDEDYNAIKIAQNVARQLLHCRELSPREIVGIGHALFALERLPKSTPGLNVGFGVSYRFGDKEFSEMKYIEFRISDSAFEICIGGSSYDQTVGSDSYSEPGWIVEINGHCSRECELYRIEDEIQEYLNLGASPSVTFESSIDMEDRDSLDTSEVEDDK